MNYTSNSLPEAFVSAGKNRLKIYNGNNVFLKDKEEFQIELFNPTTKNIGVKILINGNSISNSLLVLKPGERSHLERYIDDNRKFVFETYQVENSAAAKNAIKNNGGIRIEFFDEKVVTTPQFNWNSGTGTTNFYNYPNTLTTPTYYGTDFSCISGTSGISGTNGPEGPVGLTGNIGTSGTTTTNCNITGTSTYFTSGLINTSSSGCVQTTTNDQTKSLETGRIEKGSVSNQSFGNYYGEFEPFHFAATEYKLMPASQKPVEIKELRNYCPGCRNRIKKSTWKFCPGCGEEL
jgi:hypothetical protein